MALTIENHVYREGEGIPLILVHGFPVDHRMWDQRVGKRPVLGARTAILQPGYRARAGAWHVGRPDRGMADGHDYIVRQALAWAGL